MTVSSPSCLAAFTSCAIPVWPTAMPMTARTTSVVSEIVRTHGCFMYPSSSWDAETLGATAYHRPPAATLSRASGSGDVRSAGPVRSFDGLEPAREFRGIHGRFGPGPPVGAVRGEIERDARDGRLDRGPERPAHIGDDHVEADARDQRGSGGAEVRGAEIFHAGVVVVQLPARVAELERGVAVATVLPVDQTKPGGLLDVVVSQEVVVARHARERGDRQGRSDPLDDGSARREAGRHGEAPLRDDLSIPVGEAKHVEVAPESRPSVEDPERRGDPTRHAWLAQRLVGHGSAME